MFKPTVTEVPNSGVTELALQRPLSLVCGYDLLDVSPQTPSVISHHWYHMKTSVFYGQGLYFSHLIFKGFINFVLWLQ